MRRHQEYPEDGTVAEEAVDEAAEAEEDVAAEEATTETVAPRDAPLQSLKETPTA